MSPRYPNRPSGPFAYLDTPEWRARFVQAGLADSRCTLDEPALERLATEVINAKSLIKTSGTGKEAVGVGFKDNAVRKVETEHGILYQLEAKQSGLAGAINQFNIRFSHDVAASAEIPTPRVFTARDNGESMAVLEATFASEPALLKHLEFVEGRLAAAELARPYDLKADLEVSGQSERATYHLIRYRVGEQLWYTVAATAGSNRTRHRHDLFGLLPAAGLLGLQQDALGGPSGVRWRNPAEWRDRYTAKLNAFSELEPEDAPDPESRRWAERAARAAMVATTDAAFVIGYDPNGAAHADFDAALASTNLRTHLRGPLEFSETNQAMSHGRKLADRAFSDNALSELEHAVVTGAMAAADLSPDPREAVVMLVRLVDRLVFPSDTMGKRRVRAVLVEPAPSHLTSKHAQARAKVASALLTAAVGGVDLPAAAMDTPHQKKIREGVASSGLSAAELIVTAASEKASDERKAARAELAHLAVPGLVNGKVLLGSYGSTGDRRAVATKLAAAAASADGVTLFVEAIDAFAEVMLRRAGREAPARGAIAEGRLRRISDGKLVVNGGSDTSADSVWFTQHWPLEANGKGESSDASSALSASSPSEEWSKLVQATESVVGQAERAMQAVVDHFAAMVALVAPDRELSVDEREDWQDRLDALRPKAEEAGRSVRKLRYRPAVPGSAVPSGGADSFVFADGVAE